MTELATERTIVIDLDETLLKTDSLVEALLQLVRKEPALILRIPVWLLQGKAVLKRMVASRVQLDVASLPYNQQLIDWALEKKDAGARLVLATASNEQTARAVAEHLGIFDTVLASDSERNLKSRAKRDSLVERFGERGFEYVGDSYADVPVWRAAKTAHIVSPSSALLRRVRRHVDIGTVFRREQSALHAFVRALRVHQWAKNLLLFVPLFASHRAIDLPEIVLGLTAFLCFGMTSSCVYLVNDLLDIDDDRRHPTKKHRPIPSGALPHGIAIAAIPLMLLLAFGGSALLLPQAFMVALAGYMLLAFNYSFWLKRRVLVDVITLAILYTLRVLAGVAAFGLVATFWMLAFSVFLFLSLAFVKRYAELVALRRRQVDGPTPGRGYYPGDLELLMSLGCSSGYLSVLVLALYIQDPMTRTQYSQPELLWLSCLPLLFWVSRTWLITHRGEMHDDPVVFALKDRASLFLGMLFICVFLVAI